MNHTGKTCNIVQRPTDHHENHISGICNNTKAATAATFHVYQQTLSNLSSTVSTLPKKNAILESIGILEMDWNPRSGLFGLFASWDSFPTCELRTIHRVRRGTAQRFRIPCSEPHVVEIVNSQCARKSVCIEILSFQHCQSLSKPVGSTDLCS